MPKPITSNVQRLIAEVASQHRLLLKPDDPAFAIVTMNRIVLEDALEAVHSRVQEDLALFQSAAKQSQIRAESNLAAAVERSAAGIRREIQSDIQDARLDAFNIIRQVNDAYRKPLSRQKSLLVASVAVMLILVGLVLGRLTGHWWSF